MRRWLVARGGRVIGRLAGLAGTAPPASGAPRLALPPPARPEGLLLPGGVAAEPAISVVIPVYGKVEYTVACLDSIARAMPDAPIEVIVVDDASPDATEATLGRRADLRYLRNPENLGFIGSCNRGAELARAPYLLFLNNDTAVLPGWADALRRTLDEDPTAGLAGAQLIYPDGRLQEAGGIIWADASGWNWGRLGDPTAPAFSFRRAADYVSGAALMIPARLFRALGGFDAHYRPAYYEDTDLAFKLRALGLGVVYQPLARVVHLEGVTSGTDTSTGVKAYQVANQAKFRARWARLLAGQGLPLAPPAQFADRTPVARVLIIDATTPKPDQDSGSIDMFNLMRILLGFGIRVTFLPEAEFAHLGRYTSDLQGLGVECLHAPHVASLGALLRERGAEFDLVVLTRRDVAAAYLDLVRRHCRGAAVLFNTVDLHYLREAREAALTGTPGAVAAAERGRAVELGLVDRVDATLVVSAHEAALLAIENPSARVATIPVIREVPGRQAPAAGRRDLLFVGGFDHPPNRDAVGWFVTEILPLVRRRRPDARFHIVGSNVPPDIAALGAPPAAPGDDGDGPVVVHGHVPDLAPLFARCRLSVAPLRYGAGIKGKVATSLGFGVPCVATSIAVEGTGLADGRTILVADEPEPFADAVVRLLDDDRLWTGLSDAGLAFVEATYSLDVSRGRVARLLADLEVAPFAGCCPVCGGRARFDPGDQGQRWQHAACTGCGAEPAERALAAALLDGLGLGSPTASVRRLKGGAARLIAIGLDGPLGTALEAAGAVRAADWGSIAGPAGVIVADRWPGADGLRLARAALDRDGWLVVADADGGEADPIGHALAARDAFAQAGLEAVHSRPAVGRGLITAPVWVARPAG